MKILIAGCGWLGRALAARLAGAGHRVVAARRTPSRPDPSTTPGIDTLAVDLADPACGDALPADLDAVVACQAAGGGTPELYERAYVSVNSVLAGLGTERLVYTGSTGVFGAGDGRIVDETTPPDPTTPRANILLAGERVVRDAGGVVVRLSGLYGPGRYGILDRVRSGALALGPGDSAWMNFCHLDDAVETVVATLEGGRRGEVYHASDAHPTRRSDVVRWIAARLGIEPARSDEPPRRAADRRVSAEASRAELGVELRFPSFRDGLSAA